MKQILAAQEADYPNTFKSLLSTLKPLMRQGLPTQPGKTNGRKVTSSKSQA